MVGCASLSPPCDASIPRDDLALVAMDACLGDGIADVAAQQKPRPAPADRVAPAPARRGLESLAVLKLRQGKDVAPALPGGCDLVAVGARMQRDVQGRVAVNEDQHLHFAGLAQCDAAKI